jgi:hypothetical protein
VSQEAQHLSEALRAQLEDHHRLLGCLERKRGAIAAADIEAVTRICGEENTIVQRLTEFEKKRLGAVGRITAALAPDAAQPMTVTAIAEAIDEPGRSSLLALAEQLRATVAEVRQASTVVREASEALNRHLTGIRQTVQSALSRARVYGQGGRLTTGAPMQFSVDVAS